MINQKGIEKATKDLLKALGLNLKDPNFTETPQRVGRSYKEILHGLEDIKVEVEKLFSKSFPSENDEMVIIKNIVTYSMCPHHLLPVEMTVHVGYVPRNKVLGLSKIPRLVDLYARRPVLQEDLAVDITDSLMYHLKPQGAMAVIEARHFCMVMRGVKARESQAITSCVRGVFRDPKEQAREEFLKLINQK